MKNPVSIKSTRTDSRHWQTSPLLIGALTLLTILAIAGTAVCLYFDVPSLYQSFIYFPVTLVCILYPRYGITYTTILALISFGLTLVIPGDISNLLPALVRFAFFELIALVLVRLADHRSMSTELFGGDKKKIQELVDAQTQELAAELAQARELEHAYRQNAEFHDRMVEAVRIPILLWNDCSCITRTNTEFDRLIGCPKTEIIGRKIFDFPEINDAWRKSSSKPVMTKIRSKDGRVHRVYWVFSQVQETKENGTVKILASGMEFPHEGVSDNG